MYMVVYRAQPFGDMRHGVAAGRGEGGPMFPLAGDMGITVHDG